MEDFHIKIERIRHLLNLKQKEAIVLTSQESFAWLTGGRGHINTASETACGKILVTTSSVILITNNIECERLKAEEGGHQFDEVLSYYWFETGAEETALQSLIDTDHQQMVYEFQWEKELSDLRSLLTPFEMEKYQKLGQDAAVALEETCKTLKKGMTEWEVAAELAINCMRVGIDPVVNLVATDERVYAYRHPLPTGKPINEYVLVALGARRHGLVVSLTRLVHFGRVSRELKRKLDAVAAVDAAFMVNTRPGTELSSVFLKGRKEYEIQGFADEWRNHHQGGLTGYRSREQRVTGESIGFVKDNQAYAWNPSIAGVKSEDTIIVRQSGFEIITRTGNFPENPIIVNGHKILRPAILERVPIQI
ncbi:MAG TPA: M24 family metallopeptidase [Bacillales bacterium]|nr:M24 family metallopeptidase [Bacillales bacterium]